MTYLTKDWDFWELFWPQIFRGVGLMLAMVPINNIALGTLPPERVKNASGLLQPDAQSRRRGRPRRHLHVPQRPHRPASRAAARERHLVARQPAVETLNNLTAALRAATAATRRRWR